MKNMPQITSGWEYRPRDVTRRNAALATHAEAETAEVVPSGSSAPNENDNFWFNFTNFEPTAEEATIKVSGYD
jgi:hypothetical protein